MRRVQKKTYQGAATCEIPQCVRWPSHLEYHPQCDEQHPICANCVVTERQCGYASHSTPQSSTPAGSPSTESAEPASPSPIIETRAPTLIARPDLAYLPQSDATEQEAGSGDAVNPAHMELLVHYSLSASVPGISDALDASGTKLVLRAALTAPYLLHEVLAISARNLAVLNPARSSFYLHQAVQLQTKAIELFNSAGSHVNESNCMAMLTFSSILGRHLLTDTLAYRDDDLAVFIDRYIQYAHVHQGVRAIAHIAWPLLLETDFKSLLDSIGLQRGTVRLGSELDNLRQLVSGLHGLDSDSIAAYAKAVDNLQLGLDEFSGPAHGVVRYQMIFNWSLMGETMFVDLLRRLDPVALVVFGHYAGLLHLARGIWQIGDAGEYLVRCISNFLGPEWSQWMAWPRAVLDSA